MKGINFSLYKFQLQRLVNRTFRWKKKKSRNTLIFTIQTLNHSKHSFSIGRTVLNKFYFVWIRCGAVMKQRTFANPVQLGFRTFSLIFTIITSIFSVIVILILFFCCVCYVRSLWNQIKGDLRTNEYTKIHNVQSKRYIDCAKKKSTKNWINK